MQFFHLETANFFLSLWQFWHHPAVWSSAQSQGASLSILFNEKIGSFLPAMASASADEHCPSFQCRSYNSNGSAWMEREEGQAGRQSALSLEEAFPSHFFRLIFIPFSQLWPQRWAPAYIQGILQVGSGRAVILSRPWEVVPHAALLGTGLGCLIWHVQFLQGRGKRCFLWE